VTPERAPSPASDLFGTPPAGTATTPPAQEPLWGAPAVEAVEAEEEFEIDDDEDEPT
jgi:hypothetical protein